MASNGRKKIPVKRRACGPKIPSCRGCANCCRYVGVEIDKPTSKAEFHEIIWSIMHQGVRAYVDSYNDWHLEFVTPCRHLRDDRTCDIYGTRPDICREHDAQECETNGEGDLYKHLFRTKKDVERYVRKHTRIKNLYK